MTGFLLAVVWVYRLIPARVRSVWSFGRSTSHLAQAQLRSCGGGWAAVRVFARFAVPLMPGPSGLPDWFEGKH